MAPSLRAAAPPRIVEQEIRIGLGDGANARSRTGVWTPVQVLLQADDDVPDHAYRLIVESTDGEGVPYRYGVAVPAIPANSQRNVFAYVRPGRTGDNFTILLQTVSGDNVQEALKAQAPTAGENADAAEAAEPAFVTLKNVADMPDRWFGYEAVDVLVLTTANDGFVNGLLQMEAARRDALLEWVRRGGRLVLSVGRNQRSVARWLEKVPLLDGVLKSKLTRAALPSFQSWCGADARKQPLRQVEIACVEPRANMLGLVYEEPVPGDPHSRPVLLQSSCGLGRVVLVAFDMEGPPFSTWEGRGAFWKKLRQEIAPRATIRVAGGPIGPIVRSGELAAELKRDLETFEDVPVISFGWVALFILAYIILVGPFDYFILKRVFKRLELTWITLPVMVLLTSAAAYIAASYVKGNDLRINKIDLIDINFHDAGQIYGHSWFALLSPRIRNYTIGVDPASPRWGGSWGFDAPLPPVMVATLEGPASALGGNSRSLFRQPYEYADNATGLRRVPIPLWATRTFVSSWHVPLTDRRTKDQLPPIRAELRLSRDGKALSGPVTNNLPAELQGTVLFFQGQWYLLGDLMPGETRDVAGLFEGDVRPHTLQEWFSSTSLTPAVSALADGQRRSWRHLPSCERFRKLLCHGLLPGGDEQSNNGLRNLDAGWRVPVQGEGHERRYRSEAILIARTPPRGDRIDTVTADGVSPSRLRLVESPAVGQSRPVPNGFLQQETYVRIYVPLIRNR